MVVFRYILHEVFQNKGKWAFVYLNLIFALFAYGIISVLESQLATSFKSKAQIHMASDFLVSGRNDFPAENVEELKKILGPNFTKHTKAMRVYSMAQITNSQKTMTRLLQLNAIEENYPLYGKITASKPLSHLIENNNVFIPKQVAKQFSVNVGDTIKIGAVSFTISAIVDSDSSRGSDITLAPYIYLSMDNLKRTELLGSTSLVTYYHYFKVKKFTEELEDLIRNKITDSSLKFKSTISDEGRILRVFRNLSDYLKLVGFVAFLLSLIGQLYIFTDYLKTRQKDIGLFRALGFSHVDIIKQFTLFLCLSGLTVFLIVLLATELSIPRVLGFINQQISLDLEYSFSFSTYALILFIAVFGNVLICIPFLITLCHKKVSDLIFDPNTNLKTNLFYYIPFALFIVVISIVSTKSYIIGGLFSLVVLLFVLLLPIGVEQIFKLARVVVSKLKLTGKYKFVLVLKNFTRDSKKNVLTIMTLSGTISLIILILQLSVNLHSELSNKNSEKPSLFLFDIQPEQVEEIKKIAKSEKQKVLDISPMVQARLIKINGEEVKRLKKDDLATREDERARGFRNRTVNLSYRQRLGDFEKIIDGKWFKEDDRAEVSLETRYAQRLGIDLGDLLTFEILGIEQEAYVTSIRKVNWLSFLPNFFIVFEPGHIDEAPQTFLSAIATENDDLKFKFQTSLIDQMSNISIVDVDETSKKILEALAAAVRIIVVYGGACLIIGISLCFVIFRNYISKSKRNILLKKALGFKVTDILLVYLGECLLTLLLAVFVGAGLGITFAQLILMKFFEIEGVINFDLIAFSALFFILLVFSLIGTNLFINIKNTSKELRAISVL